MYSAFCVLVQISEAKAKEVLLEQKGNEFQDGSFFLWESVPAAWVSS